MGPALKRRIVRITIAGLPQLSAPESVADPLLDKVSSAYNEYRQGMLKVAERWPEVVENDPSVAEALWGDELMSLFAGSPTEKLGSVSNLEEMCYVRTAFGWGHVGEADTASKMTMA